MRAALPDLRPPLLEELRILRGLIELRRMGRFECIWVEYGRLYVRAAGLSEESRRPSIRIENGQVFVHSRLLERRKRITWTAAAELLESYVPRKPAGRETEHRALEVAGGKR